MKLSYRGISYDDNSTFAEMTESQTIGHYRGHAFNFAYPKHIPVPQPVLTLKYRGVAYRTTATGGVEALVPTQAIDQAVPVAPVQVPSVLQSRPAKLSELARIHRENMRRSLQHRLEVAQARGDQRLLHQLEQEMQQLV